VVTLHDPDTVVDVLTPVRRAILAALDEPDTATGLARRLGSTRQKINYHLRALEDAELVEVDEIRPRRGLTERVMRRTSDVVLVDPAAFDTSGLTRSDVAGLNAVVALATEVIGQAARASLAARDGARVAAVSLDTTVRHADPSALHSMLEQIGDGRARHASRAGLSVRVATSVLPVLEAS